ncbi:MAG TPA: hypothetical protein VFV29_07560 [Actinomycetota bacterium]|nr:hypothetical protein [Actinomycetota bacterium]
MDLLRRVMTLQALVWAACGIAIALAPRFVLVTVFELPPLPDQGYVRIAGVFAFSLSLLMVLVARRLETLWWFAWAFVLATAGSAIVAVLNALFGLPDGVSPLLWWLFAALSTAFTVGLLAGLAKTGTERPPF